MRGKTQKTSQEILKGPKDLRAPSYQPFYLALHRLRSFLPSCPVSSLHFQIAKSTLLPAATCSGGYAAGPCGKGFTRLPQGTARRGRTRALRCD
jgi:hypothetical protein